MFISGKALSTKISCCFCLRPSKRDEDTEKEEVSSIHNVYNNERTSFPSNFDASCNKAKMMRYMDIANKLPPGKTYDEATNEWIFIVWVPDCSKSRFDFLKSNQIPLDLVKNKEDFLRSCAEKQFPFSVKDYFNFKELSSISDENILEELLDDYDAKMDVSEYFWSDKHKRMMCAYSLRGKDIENMYIVLKLFTEFWKAEISKNVNVQQNRFKKVDKWLSSSPSETVHVLGNSSVSAAYLHSKFEDKESSRMGLG